MKVLVDLKVVLDVVQGRQAHYRASAEVLSRVVEGVIPAWLPAHAIPTIHYVVNRYAGREKADAVTDWLLAHFEVSGASKEVLLRARSLEFSDFEDAVCASCAAAVGCDRIVTRNLDDFRRSPVPAVSPEELLSELSASPRG